MISAKMRVKVSKIEQLTPTIKQFELSPIIGELPPFTAGSHIRFHLTSLDLIKAYSLINAPHETSTYEVAVLLCEDSQGGSKFMHHSLAEGDEIEISPPENFFPLVEDKSKKHLFIAGGIGITPFLSYLDRAIEKELPFELHYSFREEKNAAFVPFLKEKLGEKLFLYDNSENQRLEVERLIKAQPEESHVYVCGPQTLIDAVVEHGTEHLGESNVHFEIFSETGSSGNAFEVVFQRSGFSLMVDEDSSILQAIEADKRISVESLCRNGVCGTCETAILEGEADHQDLYLDEEEQAEQKTMMICVSRAKGKRIVLDL